MRWLALVAGVVLIAAAFVAATRVVDTREGLVYEVVTLLAGLAGVSLLLYGLVATLGRSRPGASAHPLAPRASDRVHNAGELLLGVSGLIVAAVLLGGIAATAGGLWAMLGTILLLPMIAGSFYLCFSFARGPRRQWKIDFRKLTGNR